MPALDLDQFNTKKTPLLLFPLKQVAIFSEILF